MMGFGDLPLASQMPVFVGSHWRELYMPVLGGPTKAA